MPQNNADLGMTIQKCICDKYKLDPSVYAQSQFESNFNPDYVDKAKTLISRIFKALGSKPVLCLTLSDAQNSNERYSPHNFLLSTGETLSIRTNKSNDKICPRVVGQGGIDTFNGFFSDIANKIVSDKQEIKEIVVNHIHQMIPTFVDYLLQSDYTVWISDFDAGEFHIFSRKNYIDWEFEKNRFSFTRDLLEWNESTTLKYDNISIAEIQIHKNRTFKFRFAMRGVMNFIRTLVQTTETFGMTAEKTICDVFELKYPDNLKKRFDPEIQRSLLPVIREAFNHLPKPVMHTGSLPGERGEQSKCSYDFLLDGNKTLSLKTNTGKMICPPEVGQPGNITCLKYFGHLCDSEDITEDVFKNMVLHRVDEMMPIYTKFLFDSDYMLWIRKNKNKFDYKIFPKELLYKFSWEKELFSFTKSTVQEWNDSNTLKYNGISIGEFQVHHNRNSFKFRFNMDNLMKLIR
jgi:hypothetical protein